VVLRQCDKSLCHRRMAGTQTAPNNGLDNGSSLLLSSLTYTPPSMGVTDHSLHYLLAATNDARRALPA